MSRTKMANMKPRTLRISDKEYASYVALSANVGEPLAATLRMQLREGAPIVRQKLGRKKR